MPSAPEPARSNAQIVLVPPAYSLELRESSPEHNDRMHRRGALRRNGQTAGARPRISIPRETRVPGYREPLDRTAATSMFVGKLRSRPATATVAAPSLRIRIEHRDCRVHSYGPLAATSGSFPNHRLPRQSCFGLVKCGPARPRHRCEHNLCATIRAIEG